MKKSTYKTEEAIQHDKKWTNTLENKKDSCYWLVDDAISLKIGEWIPQSGQPLLQRIHLNKLSSVRAVFYKYLKKKRLI